MGLPVAKNPSQTSSRLVESVEESSHQESLSGILPAHGTATTPGPLASLRETHLGLAVRRSRKETLSPDQGGLASLAQERQPASRRSLSAHFRTRSRGAKPCPSSFCEINHRHTSHDCLKTALCGGCDTRWNLPSYFRPCRHKSR